MSHYLALDTVSHSRLGRIDRLEVIDSDNDDDPRVGLVDYSRGSFVKLADDDPRATAGTRFHQDRAAAVEQATAAPGEKRTTKRS